MPLSTTGYTASGASLAALNGNYIPCAAPNATYNGATQYTNGTYFLAYIGDTGHFWYIINTVNTTGGPTSYANSPAASSTATNVPLTGWSGSSYSSTAPTFAVIVPLSTVGYIASGAGTTGGNGNYIPVTGANATWNGATQYTNGTDFLTYNGPSIPWVLCSVANVMSAPYYQNLGGSATSFPLTGWTVVASGTAPAPTFVDMAAAAIAASSISGISVISGISSISF